MILALFFTRGVSLETWVETGLFDREKLIYEEHLRSSNLERVYWLTYGSNDAKIAKQLQLEGRLHPGIDVITMPLIFKASIGKLFYSFFIPLLHRTCLKQADIYKTNQMDGSWSAVLAKFFYGKPLIVRTGYTLSAFAKRMQKSKTRILIYQLMEWLAYKNATCAIVTSEKDYKYISDTYKCLSSKLGILPNYIDTDLFKPRNIEKYIDRIVFVGRLNSEKNLFNLIKAIAKTDFTLDIYGKGELRDTLERHAKKESAQVNFKGIVPNDKLPNILIKYQYFIIPSLYEGMPKTLLEAMACGCICIGSDVEGINEVIQNEVNGFLSNGTDSEAVYNAICKAAVGNNQHIAHNAVETIHTRFSLDGIVKKEMQYLKLINID